MASIAPDLISANKQSSLDPSYEIMGFKTALANGWSWHVLSGRDRPGAGEFGRVFPPTRASKRPSPGVMARSRLKASIRHQRPAHSGQFR